VQLTRLALTNFRQHERTDIALGTGLLAVVGPNGAGKSTLLEAIAWALYGTSAARGARDTIKRRGSPPRSRVEVTLEFVLGPHHFRIVRTLTNAELAQDGVVIANSSSAVSERVESLLGMRLDEFFHTYFTGQKDLAVMAAMTPAERGRFLSRVLGYDRLKDAQDRLRERRSVRKAELAGIEQGMADPGEVAGAVERAGMQLAAAREAHEAADARATAAAEALAALEPAHVEGRERRAAWQGLDGERQVALARVQAARARFEALDRELIAALDAQRRLEPLAAQLAGWEALVAERDALDRAAAAVTARSRSLARRDQLVARLAELNNELQTLATAAGVAALLERRTAAAAAREQAARRLAERRTAWTQDAQEASTKLEFYRDRYKELREQLRAIETAGPDGKCPYCQRPLGSDTEHTVAILDAQMQEVEASGNYYRQRVEQLKHAPDDVGALERELEEREATLQGDTAAHATAAGQLARRATVEAEQLALDAERTALDAELAGAASAYDAARHEAVRTLLATLQGARREHDTLAGLAARASALAPEASDAEQQASTAEAALAELERRLAALEWDAAAFAALEARVESARRDVQAAAIEVARTGTALESAAQARESAAAREADLAAKAQLARALAAELTRWNELDRAFGDLRTDLNQQMRPDLRERASVFLQALTRGRYDDVELDEEYQASVVEDGEVKPVISGGEEDVLHLSLRLAISEMIADRAGQPLSMLVLDEIFGSLDEERRLAVVDLLRALADRFPQVILISHIEGLRDVFDRVIRVGYDEERGVSTVTEDLPEPVDVAE
jgi:exonuclease SbcC